MGLIIFLSNVRSVIFHVLLVSVLLLPITYFLAKSSVVVYFPSYLIGLSVLALLTTKEFSQVVRQSKTTLLYVVCFLIYMALSALWSANPSLKSLGLYLAYILLIITFVFSFSLLELRFPRFVELFLLLLLVSASISICYSIHLFQTLGYETPEDDRMYSMGGVSNPVISALSYGTVFVLSLSFLSQCKDRILGILIVLMMSIILIGIIYTQTRSVWVGIVAAFFTLIFVSSKSTFKHKLFQCGLAILVLLAILTIIWMLGYHESLLERSTSFRPEIWQEVTRRLPQDNLLFGYGIAANPEVHYQHLVFAHPHSIYLSTVFYGGLVGLALFFALLGRLAFVLVRNSNADLVLVMPLLVYGLVCLIVDGDKLVRKVNFIWLLVWLPVALAISQEVKSKLSTQSKPQPG